MQRFAVASWPGWLKVISAAASLILIAVSALVDRGVPHPFGFAAAGVMIAILLGSFLFVVRGYTIDSQVLSVQRLLWSTDVDLRGLTHVWHDPNGLRGSIRVWGNGGLFSLTGIFWSRSLGYYRMFATDPKKFVCMVLPKRKIVITPADPDACIREIRRLFPNAT